MCFSYTTRARPQITWDCGAMNINFAERGLKSRTTPGSTWCNNPFAPPESFLFFVFFYYFVWRDRYTQTASPLWSFSVARTCIHTHTLTKWPAPLFSAGLASEPGVGVLAAVHPHDCQPAAVWNQDLLFQECESLQNPTVAVDDWWCVLQRDFFFFFFNLRGFQTVTCCYIFVSGKPASLRKPAKSCSW